MQYYKVIPKATETALLVGYITKGKTGDSDEIVLIKAVVIIYSKAISQGELIVQSYKVI